MSFEVTIAEKYRSAANKLILLDYDGTLVDFVSIPDKAIPSKRVIAVLQKLTEQPQTRVIIISGRGHQDIDRLVGFLPLDIVAEHGAVIREKGEWKRQIAEDVSWKRVILPIIHRITMSCPKSFLEEKHYSLAWHYRNSEKTLGYDHSRKLMHLLEEVIGSYQLKVLDGNKVVEVLSTRASKGDTVANILKQQDYDFLLSIGDDLTDEDMFEVLSPRNDAYTIKVGKGKTLAKNSIAKVDQVLSFLEDLAT